MSGLQQTAALPSLCRVTMDTRIIDYAVKACKTTPIDQNVKDSGGDQAESRARRRENRKVIRSTRKTTKKSTRTARTQLTCSALCSPFTVLPVPLFPSSVKIATKVLNGELKLDLLQLERGNWRMILSSCNGSEWTEQRDVPSGTELLIVHRTGCLEYKGNVFEDDNANGSSRTLEFGKGMLNGRQNMEAKRSKMIMQLGHQALEVGKGDKNGWQDTGGRSRHELA
ncbi:hypothetical protein C8J55DRAFT_485093 [Lentinula edodes]|uniref:Uncharacterized protein n=1 Tax=Lentinula lateritia TaxID=40482 RepID=A0A9W9E049_9AGAR|nr:hypothetical protein C8J55DRAFT_485093 [Lentinula edodes]